MKTPKKIKFAGQTYQKIAEAPREWPVYESEAEKEREEVEAAFHLDGGELEEEPFAGYAYWYEGAPDYSDEARDYDHEYRTTIITGGGYLPYPEKELEDEEGGVWLLADSFTSSGETDCPFCGAGTGDFWVEMFEQTYEELPQPKDRCGLCETNYEDQPGYVYIGEGYEAVYRLVEENDEDDDY